MNYLKMPPNRPTRFVTINPRSARLILGLLLFIMAYGVISYNPPPPPPDHKGEDLSCQRAIVARIHSGETYYRAAESELRGRGYPVRSVFNWRLPLLAWLMGHLPGVAMAQFLGVLLALITFLVWFRVLEKQFSFPHVAVGSLLILGAPIYSFLPGIFLAHEFWAGTCITLSLGAHARGWRLVSIISGLAALFIRELTLPFIIIMLLLASIEARRFEVLAWIIGLIVFTAYFLIHWSIVAGLIQEGDRTLKGGWIVFGGWNFVLSTAQMNPYLFLAPPWVTAVILPLTMLGLAGWRDPLWLRVFMTVGAYVLAFLVVGKPFNRYWGFMYTNILLLGLLNVPWCLRDLWRSNKSYL
jgi:hypothetical protein